MIICHHLRYKRDIILFVSGSRYLLTFSMDESLRINLYGLSFYSYCWLYFIILRRERALNP